MSDTVVNERGAASIVVKLSKGIITITHGDSPNSVLAQWVAREGDWERLWSTIAELKTLGGTA